MELTDDQVKEAIADGRISAITLDTSVFDQNGNRFEQGLLARLKQFNGTAVRVVLSDIVVREVTSHVVRDAADAQAKVVAALKDVGKAWHVSQGERDKAMVALFGGESPEQLAERRIKGFMESASVGVVESAGRVDVGGVLDAYFGTRPPFGGVAAKKSEFPDAFALQALERWAKEEGLILLAVSKDKGWQEYCKTSPHLVASDDLANALSYFHQNAEVACARLVRRFHDGELRDLEERIASAVQDAAYEVTVIPEASSNYRYDSDVSEIDVTSVTIESVEGGQEFKVVDKPEDNVLVVEADAEAILAIDSSFTFSIVDPIDKDDVPIGFGSATADVGVAVKALLTFEGDLAGDAELVDIEVEIDRKTIYVDYGEVGPNWDDGPDDDN